MRLTGGSEGNRGSQHFSKGGGGHFVSNRGYSPDCHSVLRAHARVLLYMTDDKKRLSKSWSQVP